MKCFELDDRGKKLENKDEWGNEMGATKLNINHISAINADDLMVGDFALDGNDQCSFVVTGPIDQGEIVLIKASFKDSCESTNENDDNVLYRRRVVPLLTRVEQAQLDGERVMRVNAHIENITEEDRLFFYRKYFDNTQDETFELDVEGKKITYAQVR